MTTLNPLLARSTHPQRKPYVRSHTFVDGKGPPPYSYFDETQDHVGGLYHAALGWRYSLDPDEFAEVGERPGYLGRMFVTASTGFATAPKITGLSFGEHGVWSGRGGSSPWRFAARSGVATLDGDFLLTAKVLLVGSAGFDPAGFLVAAGDPGASPGAPGFVVAAGAWLPRAPAGATLLREDPSPATDGTWFRLQVSRVAGAIRWFVNGRLEAASYFPARVLAGGKWIQCARTGPGPAGFGFDIDSFHLLAERTS